MGVGDQMSPPLASPAHEESDVEPWDAILEWQAGANESVWHVEVSTKPYFSHDDDYQTVVADESTVEGSMTVASTKFSLKPNTTYYWRVRGVG